MIRVPSRLYFNCAKESEKRELKGYNIIGYVPDI